MSATAERVGQACDVAVIGGGPAGLAAATALKQGGVQSVLVLERESHAGGVPRHCGHPPFGMRELGRVTTGSRYAAALVERARRAGVDIRVATTVVDIEAGGRLQLSSPAGASVIEAQRVILCTGVRETPRAPRLVSGQRPLGVMTTGALQALVYLGGELPFTRPVIVGSELVSFSALLTCRHAGIRPAVMLEESQRITARTPVAALARLLGVPLTCETQLVEILGKDRVTGVLTRDVAGHERRIDSDGVLFTGQFTPEASLARMGHLDIDAASGGPVIDQYGRCSDPVYFAAGNLLRPVETAGWCWREGVRTATAVLASLADGLPPHGTGTRLTLQGAALKYVVPQVIDAADPVRGARYLQVRFRQPAAGSLSLQHGGRTLWRRTVRTRPERRVLVPLAGLVSPAGDESLALCFNAA